MPQEIKDTDCCGRSTCCCCFSLRTGCIVLGVLGVIGGAFGVVGASVVIGVVEVQAKEMVKNYRQVNAENQYLTEDDIAAAEVGKETVVIVQSVHLILAAISLVINSLMLHGAIKGKHKFILPYLVYVALQMILGTAAIVAIGVYLGTKAGGAEAAVYTLVAVPFLALGFYLWNAVRRHYKDLRQAEIQPMDQEINGTFRKGEVAYVKMSY
jgi:drug/metabolite transporter (DMT)-like permease